MKKQNVKEEDRLSNLPDSILFHILTFLNTKEVIQTSILSKRWNNNQWKYLPIISLISSHFNSYKAFTIFVSQIMSLRDASTPLRALDLHRDSIIEPRLLEKILNYAVSKNVERLKIDVQCDIVEFPICLFSCHALTSLSFYVNPILNNKKILFPNSLNLPALTSLCLGYIAFRGGDEPFLAYPKLNNLMISHFDILGERNLCISSTTLVELTIETYYRRPDNYPKIELSTPRLCTFSFIGTPCRILFGSYLCSIKHVNIEATMVSISTKPSSNLLSWLLELADIKSLTITSSTLQVLSLAPNLSKVKLHSLCNLKSLRVKMEPLSYGLSKTLVEAKSAQLSVRSPKEVSDLREAFKKASLSIPHIIVGFLIQNSPSAEVHIIEWIQKVD